MANPFDEFDAPAQRANPFDEFDSDPVRQIPGMENSVPSDSNLGKDDTSVTDKIKGVVEAAMFAGAGIPATLAEAWGQKVFGTTPGKVSEEFYQPRTEKGKEYANEVGEFANRYLNPLMGGIGAANFRPKMPVKGKETPLDRIEQRQAELDAQKAREATKEPVKENTTSPVAEDVARLHDQAIMERLKEIDRERTALQRRSQAMFGEKTFSEEPLTVDPQGQVFRGDVKEPDARLGLERQTEAFDNAATHNQWEQPGDPLPLLSRENLRAANEGPQAEWVPLLQEQLRQELVNTRPTVHGEKLNPVDFMSPETKMRPFRERAANRGPVPEGRGMPENANTLPKERIPFRGRGGKQAGAINPEVFQEGFAKAKDLLFDGLGKIKFIARYEGKYDELRIDAYSIKDGGAPIGGVSFSRTGGDNLHSFSTRVADEAQRKGVATELYKFASELGNDIVPSGDQSYKGKAMWEGFAKSGLAKDGIIKSPGNRQRGALRIGERKQKQLEKVFGKDNRIPENPDPKAVIEEALAEGRDSNQWNYTESGSTLAAMKRASAAVLGISRIIQGSTKRADLSIRKKVFPVERALRKLSKSEIVELSSVMTKEMFNGKRFDAEAISQMSVKQQVAYAHIRAMFEDTLRIQNEGRAAKGQEPITELEAYSSSRWEGDFRRPVFETVLDKNGNPKINPDGTLARKTVWYLAAHTKKGLEKQWQALKKERPDLAFDPKEDHVVRYYKRQTDLQSAYSTMLDILGRNEDAVKLLKEAVEQQSINEQASFLGQEKHFKTKAGIRGFVGDRPGKSGPSEALSFFQQQIQYAKNAYKWSEIQKSSDVIKEIVSNPELVKQQPNNMKYVKEYIKNALGHGEALAVAHLEDSVRNLGFSPTVISNALGGMKTIFILQKLGVSTGYTIANLLQTVNVFPHLTDQFAKGYRGNPLTAIPLGILGGIAMATGHYASFFREAAGKGAILTKEQYFWERAFKYAEDNGVTARSVYDEAPIESSFSKVGMVGNALGKTMSVPETFVRSMAYSMFVEFFRSSGKFKNEQALFQKAEELVNASMVDYRSAERPMVFHKLGMVGEFLNTLQTYPANWYNQWNYMGREAMKGNIAPFITMFMVQYGVAGAMGIPGFDDISKLYDFLKEHMPAETFIKLKQNEFWNDPKLWMVKNFGQAAVYGALSDKSGIGLSSRVSAPGMGQMIQAPVGPAIDIIKQVSNLRAAVLDSTNKTKWAQFGMGSLPPGLQGQLETHPSMEGTTFERRTDGTASQRPGDLADHAATYVRTPEEETLRKFGLRSQKEVVTKEMNYRLDRDTKIAEKKARDIPNAFYDAVKRNDKAKARDLYIAYTKLTGNGISDAAFEQQIQQNYLTTFERSASAARSVVAIQNIKRMRDLLKQIREENQ